MEAPDAADLLPLLFLRLHRHDNSPLFLSVSLLLWPSGWLVPPAPPQGYYALLSEAACCWLLSAT